MKEEAIDKLKKLTEIFDEQKELKFENLFLSKEG